jgi:hypothetical protein
MAGNLKDTVTSITGYAAVVAGFIVLLSQSGMAIPKWAIIVAGAIPFLCQGIQGVASGKNPNLTTKTPRQVDNINNEAAATKDIV